MLPRYTCEVRHTGLGKYGPDAYEFAKGKPLTLMNGGNLLFLLEKHGHKAKIEIKEAKRILGEKVE